MKSIAVQVIKSAGKSNALVLQFLVLTFMFTKDSIISFVTIHDISNLAHKTFYKYCVYVYIDIEKIIDLAVKRYFMIIIFRAKLYWSIPTICVSQTVAKYYIIKIILIWSLCFKQWSVIGVTVYDWLKLYMKNQLLWHAATFVQYKRKKCIKYSISNTHKRNNHWKYICMQCDVHIRAKD